MAWWVNLYLVDYIGVYDETWNMYLYFTSSKMNNTMQQQQKKVLFEWIFSGKKFCYDPKEIPIWLVGLKRQLFLPQITIKKSNFGHFGRF